MDEDSTYEAYNMVVFDSLIEAEDGDVTFLLDALELR